MDKPIAIKPLIAALQHALTGASTLQRISHMRELTERLTGALTLVADMMARGASFHGDLGDGTDADEVEEATGMDQEHMLRVMELLDEVGIAPHARWDAVARAEQRFGSHAVEDWEARDWAQRLRGDAPHLFTQAAPASTTTAAPGRSARKRPDPLQPPRSVRVQWDHVPALQRAMNLRE
jgi:hypothetical protein